MPTPNYSPDDALLRTILDLKNRVHALESQTNFAVRDGSGTLRVQSGLLQDPATGLSTGDYGFAVGDANGNVHVVNPFYPYGDNSLYSTSSSSYVSVGYPGITVPVGASGSVLIIGAANLITTVPGDTATVGISIDGGAPSGWFIAAGIAGAAISGVTASAAYVFPSGFFTSGNHTLTYWAKSNGGHLVEFDNAFLMGWPV